ncbi:MAG: DUF1667 domain-containing protein [Clostridia bacterium]|nr:DUF1667 domain-containing protein [Clostridia bacterium]
MNRSLTCIVCPNGCTITAELDEHGAVCALSGAACPRGEAYARQEIERPMRMIASSVRVTGGAAPLVSVRMTKPIPKGEIMRVMEAIRSASVPAPVAAGDVIIADVLGLGSDVIATRSIDQKAV